MELPPDEVKPGAPEWVVTFGDMMTLLLCFFVLLLSFSTMEAERFKVLAGYVRQAFGVQSEHHYTEIPSGDTVVAVEFNPPMANREVVYEKIVDLLDAMGMKTMAEAELDEQGTRVRVDGSLLFSSGSARVESGGIEFLRQLALTMKQTGSGAVVEGHSDNQPINSGVFPSNWELSAARAGAIVRELELQGIPSNHLQVAAFADTRPITGNETAEGRARNRRVELLIKPN